MAHPNDEHHIEGAIVVGIDGSAISKRALSWAARQAGFQHRPLHAVMTWEYPAGAALELPAMGEIDLAERAKQDLDEAIHDVLGPTPGIEIWASVIEGHPAPTLLRLAETAECVVVGSRGHGAFTGMLLGSTGTFLSTHCHCPVIIVREPPSSQ